VDYFSDVHFILAFPLPSSRAGSFFFIRQKEGKRLAKIIASAAQAGRWPGILAGRRAFIEEIQQIIFLSVIGK
jgi:hypothetical protein